MFIGIGINKKRQNAFSEVGCNYNCNNRRIVVVGIGFSSSRLGFIQG